MKKKDKQKVWIVAVVFTALMVASAFAMLAIGIVGVSAGGPTYVSGIISSDTTWTAADSPYIVTGSILVEEGVTLTIDPGVVVKFENETYMKIEGYLVAQGTKSNGITFTSNAALPNEGDWGGIRIRPTAGTTFDGNDNYINGSVLDYVTIKYATTGLYIFNTAFLVTHSSFLNNSIAIEIRTTNHIVIKNNAFINNQNCIWSIYEDYYGDMVSHIIDTQIHDNVFLNNNLGVNLNINQRNFEALDIANNEFLGNDIAVEIGGGGYGPKAHSIFVTNNWIRGNGGGISFPQFYDKAVGAIPEYQVIVQYNIIVKNTGDPLSIGRTGNVRFLIENNTLAENEGGIPLYGSHYVSGQVFRYNCVAHNSYGINIGGSDSYHPNDWHFYANTFSRNSGNNSNNLINILYGSGFQVSYNNFLNNSVTYVVANNVSSDVPAKNNYWGTTITSQIDSMIYDYYDDFEYGKVLYNPILTAINTKAPISPPTDLTATAGDSDINLSWSANPETDLAGYKVYYDTDSGYPYDGTGANEGDSEIDVGDTTSYQLSGLINGVKYYVAITAYDTTGDGSWYSIEETATPIVLLEKIFDTGAPANPYPSIMGNHTGTIRPNHTVIATKLYTYPCVGTGGHTEYAKIWNKTIGECAVAEWNGYIGDYHNISFNKTLTLEEGVIYNYNIRTGSYPQIIHEPSFNATGGTITCDKFIDANGKIYYDWIPAIRLGAW